MLKLSDLALFLEHSNHNHFAIYTWSFQNLESFLLMCLVIFDPVLSIIFEKLFRNNKTKDDILFLQRQFSFASAKYVGTLKSQDHLNLVLGLGIS